MPPQTDKQSKQAVRLPFGQPIARRLLEELFGSQQLWKSNDLKQRVVRLHQERGGFTPPEPTLMINRALQDLKRPGWVSGRYNGSLRWTARSQEGRENLQGRPESPQL